MRLTTAVLALAIAGSASAVTMDWKPIGNLANACEPQSQGCFGAVPYLYGIGTYEVTNAQYAEFLNAKAASDPLGLYNPEMGTADPASFQFGGIERTGPDGSHRYHVIAGRDDKPVSYVSFFDAVRFANWMNNGQGNGDTETGAYTLLGGTATPSNGDTVARNAGAEIALPSENEWYKAAYHNAGGLSALDYWNYPTGWNTQPTCSAPTATPNRGNCPGLGVDLTNKGSYPGSPSPYGTFDQFGNVEEWNEAIRESLGSATRGSWGGGSANVFGFAGRHPTQEWQFTGFRLVLIPEPSTGPLMIAGLLGIAARRRLRFASRSD